MRSHHAFGNMVGNAVNFEGYEYNESGDIFNQVVAEQVGNC